MSIPIIAFGIWLVFLTGLTFLFWMRPGHFRTSQVLDFYPMMASFLAVLLFLSCFLLGVWISVAQLRGIV